MAATTQAAGGGGGRFGHSVVQTQYFYPQKLWIRLWKKMGRMA